MEAIGLLVTLEAHAGKEADAEAFLKSAQPLAVNEVAATRANPSRQLAQLHFNYNSRTLIHDEV